MKMRLIAALFVLAALACGQELQATDLPVTAKLKLVSVHQHSFQYSVEFTNDSDESIYLPRLSGSECTGLGLHETFSGGDGKALARRAHCRCGTREGKLAVWIGVPEDSFELRPRQTIAILKTVRFDEYGVKRGRYQLALRILGWTPQQLEALRLPGKLDTLRGKPLIGFLDAGWVAVDIK
jgi:hypothetical protein